jgi:hypothetical protein
MNLVGLIERNSVLCVGNCDEEPDKLVTSGGYIMSWSDEYWKGVGYGPDSGRGCPDFNPNIQSQCGMWKAMFPDWFMNEEWWGMVSVQKGCEAGDPDRVTPRLAFLQASNTTLHASPRAHPVLPPRASPPAPEPDQPTSCSLFSLRFYGTRVGALRSTGLAAAGRSLRHALILH